MSHLVPQLKQLINEKKTIELEQFLSENIKSIEVINKNNKRQTKKLRFC